MPTAVASGNSATITVTLDDQSNPAQPVAGKAVTLAQNVGAQSTITVTQGTTDVHGQAKFTVTDTAAEAVTYTASDTTDGIALTGAHATVTFGTLSVSATASTVVANPTSVSNAAVLGVLPTGTVTVTLIAPDGHSVVSGKTVTLTSTSSHVIITPPATPNVTDVNGRATFTVSDATAENVTFTAHDTTDGVDTAETATVSFEAPKASATSSTLTASSTTEPADGVTSVTLVVSIRDQFGNPLPGVVLAATGNPSATTRVAPEAASVNVTPGTTDSTGKALFLAYDTAAESVTYTAADTTDNVTLSQTVAVTFLATAPQANNSTLSANPGSVPADGTTSSTITVALHDHNSNPVPGKAITLAGATGSSTITPLAPTTDAMGQATFKVTDTKDESVFYSATDTTDALVLAGQGVTVTFGTPPPRVPTIADSTISSSAPQAPADGTSAVTITVVLADSNGAAVPGKTVALNPASGDAAVAAVTAKTDADGQATFKVTDRTVEAVMLTATDVTDSMPFTGQSVTVTFTTPPAGAAAAPTGSSGSTDTGAGDAGVGSGSSGSAPVDATSSSTDASATLALTGIPAFVPWVVSVGALLFLLGAIGRRRVTATGAP